MDFILKLAGITALFAFAVSCGSGMLHDLWAWKQERRDEERREVRRQKRQEQEPWK